jgi:hypothetical protein
LKSSWEREKCIDICTFQERKGTGWWKMGIWRLKGMRGNTDKGVCLYAGKKREGGTSCNVKVQGSGGTGGWKECLLHPEIGIKKIASNKTRDNWTKIAQYLIKYKHKWERSVKKVTKEIKWGRVRKTSDREIKCNGQHLYIDLDIDIE